MKRLALSMTLIATLAASSTAFADPPWARGPYDYDRDAYIDYARVLDVAAITAPAYMPQRECRTVPVEQRTVVGSQRNAASTLLGAVIGGVLGHTLGKGDGRRAATVAGAVIGGAIGHESTPPDRREVYRRMAYARACDSRPVYAGDRVVAYAVTYRYHGRIFRSRMDHAPGPFVRVRVDDGVFPAE